MYVHRRHRCAVSQLLLSHGPCQQNPLLHKLESGIVGKGSLVSSNRAAQYAPAWKGNLDAEVHIIGVSAPASERVHGLPRCLTLPPAFSFHCSPSVPVGFSRLRHVEAKCDSSDGDQGVKSATVTVQSLAPKFATRMPLLIPCSFSSLASQHR